MSVQSTSGVSIQTFSYENFQGLDTSRDITSLDTGEQQHLVQLTNGFCDWRGQIVRDPTVAFRKGDHKVNHVKFYGKKNVVWVEETGSALNFRSDADHFLENVHPIGSIVTSTVFNQSVHFASKGRATYRYDGTSFTRNQSADLNNLTPAFINSIQRRMVVAGIPGRETQVHFSRVDNEEVFPDDEDDNSTNVLRAGFIDIANLLGTADQITGLGAFEQNRLCVFTGDRAIIYKIDPSIDNWLIDDDTFINIGCASHNTICNAGTDLMFCSRSGIHSIKRSEENGILVYSYSLSDKIDILYRELFASVPDPQQISAVFDQDMAQYHVFFPQAGNVLCKRLTLALNPEGGEAQPKFNTGDFLNSRCGAFLGGQLVFGTTGGVYNVNQVEDETGFVPELTIMTPLLWHGSLTDTKDTHSVIIQAAGKGTITMEAQDLDGKQVGSLVFEVDDTTDDNYFVGEPISKQYERKWSFRYKAAQYSFKATGGGGLLRLIGFAVNVKK